MSERHTSSPALSALSVASMSQVDVGPVIAEVARSLWSEIERRAGLAIDIDAAGPVVADEIQLHRLLRQITQHVLERVPQDAPGEHIVGFSARARPDDALVIDVRHTQRDLPRGAPGLADSFDLGPWRALAKQFAAEVDRVEEPQQLQCFRVTLRLAI